MELQEATKENMTYMFEKLQERLNVVNRAILDQMAIRYHVMKIFVMYTITSFIILI
ncbi:hypothetical protein JCM19039_540 [Geomicrobium sp. JCM 19039]|nr:DUF1128 family protein [Geomicrobium sp. JCM 19039]GAK10885.1 hypothetical protein JCM19039_540 [Geomicrobium sp. JCM 19039]